ncbi:MAG: preprotein translocase subunit SecG [Deltaproteobacteria bacterium]|jgi:preprotein translocase subunit SecG|nr:preprotein translocase subunit SecG [Deltaproteobacteria bacterium]
MATSSFLHSGITIIHVIAALILMVSVLLQTGKGSGLGAAFGGSSSSVFGARGPAGLIAKVTAVAAVIFMTTSFTLAMAARGGAGASIVPDDVGSPPPVSDEASAPEADVSAPPVTSPAAAGDGGPDGAVSPAVDAGGTAPSAAGDGDASMPPETGGEGGGTVADGSGAVPAAGSPAQPAIGSPADSSAAEPADGGDGPAAE